jgi:hypothetical protein
MANGLEMMRQIALEALRLLQVWAQLDATSILTAHVPSLGVTYQWVRGKRESGLAAALKRKCGQR